MTSKRWYWLALGLVLVGIGLGVNGCRGLVSKVEGLHRVVMPAKVEMALPAGDTTLYTEQTSIVDGKVYEITGDFEFRCSVNDPTGTSVPIERASSSVTYTFGGYAGRNTFDLHVETAGTYVVQCESPRQFVIAVGSGIGTQIVIALVGTLIPVLLGVLTFVLVLVLRITQRSKRLRQTAPPL